MKYVIANDIRVEQPSQEVISYANAQLILDNPEYAKKERMGYWTGETPKKICLFSQDVDTLILPYGCLSDLWKFKPFDYETHFAPAQRNIMEGSINLYPYQQRALEDLLRGKNGVLEAPCGSGKTQIGLALIKSLGLKALWLTHTQKLLLQSKQRCETYFKGDFGTITEGKVNIGRDITFATIQTMAKLDPRLYKDAFNVVVVDECHHCAGTPTQVHQFYKVVTNCNARYKYGMSATLARGDGLIRSVFAILGEKLHTITSEEIGNKIIRALHQEFPITWKYKMEEYCAYDGTLDYAKMIDAICGCKARNYQIATNVIKNRVLGKKQLILTARVSHAQELQRLIPNSSLCVGNIKEKDRDYSNNVIIATYALAKEGLDIPSLDVLHLATPTKDKATIVQSVGRIERNTQGKNTPICYDYVDEEIPYCVNAFKKRRAILKRR